MASSSSNRKRSFLETDDDSKPPQAKRVRFPKGKKVKFGDEGGNKSSSTPEVSGPVDLQDPKLAAKERAKRRSANTTELFNEDGRVEVTYQENEMFVDDGIHMDPFNLDQEREEGFFEKDGNYVEYVNNNEIKDAWLDSLGVHTELAPKAKGPTINDDDTKELSAEDIWRIKRRIADSLEPGETVLQALKRLKGTSKNRKEKMPAETKRLFDQLTEDAMKLLENGEYDVYQELQEVFVREAEGYERLVMARDGDPSASLLGGVGSGLSLPSASTIEAPGNDDDYDMFGDGDGDDDNNNTTGNVSASAPTDSANGDSQSDYVFDDATGYYYSSSLGYYYDPSTGLYCSAASGQWYSYNETTGAYEEIPANESNANN